MNYKLLFVALTMIFILILLVVFLSKKILDQTKKDWATLEDLEDRANKVTTKEQIEDLHNEFLTKQAKINNYLITPRLARLDGYLRGKYNQYRS